MNASFHKANDLSSRRTHPGDISGLSEQNHDRNLYSSATEQAGSKRGIRVRLAIDKNEFLEGRGIRCRQPQSEGGKWRARALHINGRYC